MRIQAATAISILFASPILAQEGRVTNFNGYLIYHDCVQLTDGRFDQQQTLDAYDQRRATNLRSNYEFISNGQIYSLDSRGNQLARSIITTWNARHPLMVNIRGKAFGSKIDVEQISNISIQTF